MREYSFIIRDAMSNGLRPKGMGRNTPYFDEMLNLVPFGQVARTPKPVTFPITGLTLSGEWPWPQLVHDGAVTLLADKANLYAVDPSDWSATLLTGALSASTPYQLAAFEDCWFLSNGANLYYYLPYFDTAVHTFTQGVPAITKHDARLFLGGVAIETGAAGDWWRGPEWQSVVDRWRQVAPEQVFVSETTVAPANHWLFWTDASGGADDMPFYVFLSMLGVWGSAGFAKVQELIMTAIEQRAIGFVPLPASGPVMRAVPFRNDMLAFCGDGVCRVSWNRESRYYDAVRLDALELINPAAVDSHNDEAVFMDKSHTVWRYFLEDRFFRARKHQYAVLDGMNGANVHVVRDPMRGNYYIGDGTTAYVLTETGLGGPVEVIPSSLGVFAGSLIGYTFDVGNGTRKARLVSAPMDINERGTKHISAYQIVQDGLQNVKAAVDYRYGSGAWSRSPLVAATAAGVAYPGVSCVDGRMVVEGEVINENAGAHLERIEVRYQAEDRSSRRGTKGVPETD